MRLRFIIFWIITLSIASLLFLSKHDGISGATSVIYPYGGGTGTSSTPSYGLLLVGNANGTFTLTATSSLGITGTGTGTNDWGTFGITYGENSLKTSSTFPVWIQDNLYVSSTAYFPGLVATSVSSTYSSSTLLTTGNLTVLNSLSLPANSVTDAMIASASTWNAKESALTFSFPLIRTTNAISFGGLTTSSAISAASGLLYATGVNTIASISTSTAVNMSITGNAGTVTNGVYTTGAGSVFEVPLTAGDGLTRTVNDIDCDIASGSVFGCLSIADWTTFNGKQATISVTYPVTLSGATVGLAFGTTTANSWSQLQTFTGLISTASSSFIGKLNIQSVSVSSTFYMQDGLNVGQIIPHRFVLFNYSTSTAWTGTTTIYLAPADAGETWIRIKCESPVGTVNVSIYDGTNRMDMLNASSTIGTFNLTTNNSFIANESRRVDIGTPASSPTTVACKAVYNLN